MKRILSGAAALLVLSCGAAFASHGKAGLWNVATTMNMTMTLPPEVIAQMKKAGMSMPSTHTIANQICMTQAEVDSDKPPQMDKNNAGCETHITSQTSSRMAAEMVCTGRMKGAGHVEVVYHGAEHYTGSYNFKGSVEGNPSSMSSTMKGDWIKTDCGAVKPHLAK